MNQMSSVVVVVLAGRRVQSKLAAVAAVLQVDQKALWMRVVVAAAAVLQAVQKDQWKQVAAAAAALQIGRRGQWRQVVVVVDLQVGQRSL